MKARVLCLFLCFLGIVACYGQVLSVDGQQGSKAIYIGKPASGTMAEGFIFSTKSGKIRRRQSKIKPKVIVTGVYSSQIQSSEDNGNENKYIEHLDASKAKKIQSSANKNEPEKHAIAWTSVGSEYYHDYLSSHEGQIEKNKDEKKSSRIWVTDIRQLAGLKPCLDCFVKVNHTPEFIKQECGGLDLASATQLLDNPKFIEWATVHLPIMKLSFLTSSKILVVAKVTMTNKALKELAKETAAAFRRHTWRVAEVIAQNKNSEIQEHSY